jgi:phosphoserine phosphatase
MTHPDMMRLSVGFVNEVIADLGKAEVEVVGTEWLSPTCACDIVFAAEAEGIAESVVVKHIGDEPIDVIIQPYTTRRKKMLVSDMDSTMIQQECIDELADMAGIKSQVSEITERAMNGELNFEAALKERLMLLKGLKETILEQVYRERIRFMPGAKELMATMKRDGAFCVLVSGGFTYFTEHVSEALGFDEHRGNVLDVEAGVLTGEAVEPILGKEAKVHTLETLAASQSINMLRTLALGDGANDLPMLQKAGLGIAYHAKPAVQKAARAKINHCDLTAVLYAQGFFVEEIVTSYPSAA